MKVLSLVSVTLVVVATAALFFTFSPHGAPRPAEPLQPALEQPLKTIAAGERRPVPLPQPDHSEQLLQQMEKMVTLLESLEASVGEMRTEISIRSETRSRVAVSDSPASVRPKLDDEDLNNLRKLLREALVDEAWKQRQKELVDVGRHLALQLQLETKIIDPMIEVLCVDGLPLFNLERELADKNHDKTLAKRRLGDFKLARRRLREDLGSTLRNDDLAARVFLHVVSGGEVASISMDRDRLLATEKDWLR